MEATVAEHAASQKRKQMERMYEGAARYAAADRSDPFTRDRCIAHIKAGVASYTRTGNSEYGITAGTYAYYDAEPYQEERRYVHDGREVTYSVTAYKNLVRA